MAYSKSHRIGGTQSIGRATFILRLVAASGTKGARLVELVKKSRLTKATVHRILMALAHEGMIEHDSITKSYFLGQESFVLGVVAAARYGIHSQALPALRRLAAISQDTVFLSVIRGLEVVYIHREEGSFPIRSHVLQAGDRHPLGVSSAGQAVLAAMPDDEIEKIVTANARNIAEHYPRYSLAKVHKLVSEARARGYALNPGLIWPGSWGIGVAVKDHLGHPVAALTISAIESRLQKDQQKKLALALTREASALSRSLSTSSPVWGVPGSHDSSSPRFAN
jgi:DNA-binding IclR family transcriptional regulator